MNVIGNAEAATKAKDANAINIAGMIRELELLRSVVDAAIRLRGMGRACDKIEEGMEELWRDNPDQTRCATPMIMVRQAFDTAMQKFDEAVLTAAEAGMEWAPLPKLGPKESAIADKEQR